MDPFRIVFETDYGKISGDAKRTHTRTTTDQKEEKLEKELFTCVILFILLLECLLDKRRSKKELSLCFFVIHNQLRAHFPSKLFRTCAIL